MPMNPYDDFFSDDEETFKNEKIVKLKSVVRKSFKKKKGKSKTVEQYDSVRDKILTSYKKAVICPLNNMNTMICEEHGSMFDYKTAKCRVGGFHGHKTLTKYLNCCDDLVTILTFSQPYALKNGYKAKDLIEKRTSAHIKHQFPGCLNYHVEILLVNLFPLKVTLPVKDMEQIFFSVYGYKFNSIIGPIEKIINDMKSPNLFISVTGKQRMVTCIPTQSLDYSDFGDINLFTKVHELENCILKDSKSIFKEESVPINKKNIIIPYNEVLGDVDKKLEGLFTSFDLNIPRYVQNPLSLTGSTSLYQKCYDTEEGLKFYWAFLSENLLLEEKDAYFDINTDFF
ncbi:hypothetical protein SLOPH_710 [Spraguea lophii 42_110]|uniref:Uncharacterized protein n=1 Tax=Spraguea lophii (strain 42_110) TaxID=1358809 RepID=S7WCU4_SPRLO|nr:hypothetical protein SLOPH_710 [Spraguea lophii 42_110]